MTDNKNLTEIKISNNIALIFKMRKVDPFEPSEELLNELKMTRDEYHLIFNNKQQPSFEQAYLLSRWLGINLYHLYKVKPYTEEYWDEHWIKLVVFNDRRESELNPKCVK